MKTHCESFRRNLAMIDMFHSPFFPENVSCDWTFWPQYVAFVMFMLLAFSVDTVTTAIAKEQGMR